ncbi:pyridoxamine 5'-phosphate oxidase family protein [Leptolyngbya sp. FACHB-321]|uniref:pyridoxamine 5'-phosphate oxidase family protein n=1 Tax=Leptolyngbya sp. FACHB-321 TaxID=2692807 RepID=UPI001689B207|nr:pyridoxamine 5'-phosphate oxidase family protein [Leptolyngbya sp. FACHB-321]MBD2034834.1 pyridoxamine 5'-phosphate oxidase family protein [Leptolyngbya sp. FACHB-321]
MTSFHPGEQAVQSRVGVRAEADRLGHLLNATIKPAAQTFLQSQSWAIASSVDTNGHVWASLLTGAPGFVQPITNQSIQINAMPIAGDPLCAALQSGNAMGLLVIDLATRRRLRLNGTIAMQPDGAIHLHTKQVYFNCPQYIQLRQLEASAIAPTGLAEAIVSSTLSPSQQQWLAQVDTFFIASSHPDGADVSHRGGNPGFVQVVKANKLVFPDYAGNNMFNTLGNLFQQPQAGLLFLDFEQGNTLQLTGTAQIIWDSEALAAFAGAQRLIEFEVSQAIATTNALPYRWRFVEYSPYNPI